eukprot:Nitzschia sp. Nitz4//scaffold91_size79674//61969//64296//NITZ4_005377-RA/size79674-augustus-gene-0.82-mRNA-1//1//CDS//3329560130//8453//frame0
MGHRLATLIGWIAILLVAGFGRSVPLWSTVCQDETSQSLPYCDISLDLEDRVMDYVGRVPVEQQIAMMGNLAKPYDALRIPEYNWWSEGLHGPMEPCVPYDGECRCATSFPCPSALGGSFNSTLFELIAQATAKEGRAISELRNHDGSIGDGLTYWSPNINLQRDPRWGRNQEVPGEDPLLTSVYAQHFVRGLQQNPDNDESIRVAACCKHFVANSLEHWHDFSRHTFDAHVSMEDLQNYYYAPFEQCVKAGAAGIMCSYNALNGQPNCINQELLVDTLRGEWQFDGYIVSDCGALEDTISGHHSAVDAVQAAALAINATVDVNCGKVYAKGLWKALDEGWVESTTIEESFQRLARVQFKLGLFDPKTSEPDKASATIGSHKQLSLEAARQTIALLKNDQGILPLHPDQKLAIIGPHANATEAFLSNYHGDVCSCDSDKAQYDCIRTPLQAFSTKSHFPVEFARGCPVTGGDQEDIESAVEIAESVDVVVLIMGLDQSQEREELDRNATTLPGLQTELIRRVLEVASDRTVLMLVSGGTVSLGQTIKETAHAILAAPYGGPEAAQAMVDVLYGDYNPSAKLAATMYTPTFTETPMNEMGLQKGLGRTHMYYDGPVEFPFGHGLSYSNWSLQWVHSDFTDLSDPRTFLVNVTNQGPLVGSQTVLLLWKPKFPHRIRQKLAGFKGTRNLGVGESEIIEFNTSDATFALWDSETQGKVVHPGDYLFEAHTAGVSVTSLIRVPSSSREGQVSTDIL